MTLYKLLKDKKAGQGSELAWQAFIEISLAVLLIIFCVAYASYIIKDTRIYQVFISKDMSFIQDSTLLIDDDVTVTYFPSFETKFHLFTYDFSDYYTTVMYSQKESTNEKDSVSKKYIHFKAPPYLSYSEDINIPRGGTVWFSKSGDAYKISEDILKIQQKKKECNDAQFSDNINQAYVYFDYSSYKVLLPLVSTFDLVQSEEKKFDDLLNSMFFTVANQYSWTKTQLYGDFVKMKAEGPAKEMKKVYIRFEESSDGKTVLHVPGDSRSTLGCKLYNELISGNVDAHYIPTTTGKIMGSFTYSLLIVTPHENNQLMLTKLKSILGAK